MSAFLLGGCGSSAMPGSSGSATTSSTSSQQTFAVPQALQQAVPPAPRWTAPPAPPSFSPPAIPSASVSANSASVRRIANTGACTACTTVRFHTTLGDMDVQLRPDVAPKNVANFLSYVNSGAYTNSIVHRSVPSFVIQGGGYSVSNGQINTVATQPPVVNEYNLSNVRGTLAMALSANNPNSATSQWFFNEVDNSATLNPQQFTVIGSITSSYGLAVMDAIGALPVTNAGGVFTQLPVVNYTSGQTVQISNLVSVSSITVLPAPTFFANQVYLGSDVDYLAFANGNVFGYYAFLPTTNFLYHFDLGYEYVFDAQDGVGGVYLYDFGSGHFFYTSPTYPFPYIYDFTLNSTLYYYPDPTRPGRYTSNPRYFYNFSTGKIISQ